MAALKAKRAERFGIPVKEAPVASAPKKQGKGKEKGKPVAKPTLASKSAPVPLDPEVAEKLKKRAERFGIPDKHSAPASVGKAPTVSAAVSVSMYCVF